MCDMQALMFHGRRDIRLVRLPRPRPGRGEVLMQVTDAGLGQAQINEFIEGPYIISATPHPRTGLGAPLIPCQEFGGQVVEVGEGVDPRWIGKAAAVLPLLPCGQCDRCRAGQPNLCSTLAYRGLVGAHGGFCGFCTVSEKDLFAVQRRDLLSFVEPLLVGVHSLHRAGPDLAGKSVLVLGAGAVGCAIAAVWTCIGDTRLMVHDRLPERLARAREVGFEVLGDLSGAAASFDVVIDAAGKDTMAETQALELAYGLVHPGGTVLSVGTYFSPLSMVPAAQLVAEHTTLPSFAYDFRDVAALKEWIERIDVRFDPLIQRLRLDQLVEHGYYEAELDKSRFTRFVCSEQG